VAWDGQTTGGGRGAAGAGTDDCAITDCAVQHAVAAAAGWSSVMPALLGVVPGLLCVKGLGEGRAWLLVLQAMRPAVVLSRGLQPLRHVTF